MSKDYAPIRWPGGACGTQPGHVEREDAVGVRSKPSDVEREKSVSRNRSTIEPESWAASSGGRTRIEG